jgi:fructoselysine 6-kinase
LVENGVVTDHVRVVAGGTAFTDIGSDANGERVMLFEDFGVCRGYRPCPREVERLCSLRHVHIGWLDDGGWLKRRLAAAGVSVSQDLSVNAGPADIGPLRSRSGSLPRPALRTPRNVCSSRC